jgi:hypothetical protein
MYYISNEKKSKFFFTSGRWVHPTTHPDKAGMAVRGPTHTHQIRRIRCPTRWRCPNAKPTDCCASSPRFDSRRYLPLPLPCYSPPQFPFLFPATRLAPQMRRKPTTSCLPTTMTGTRMTLAAQRLHGASAWCWRRPCRRLCCCGERLCLEGKELRCLGLDPVIGAV